jgi:ABC-type glycerol-3-phosphate transport system substrate-binding protein
MKKYLVLLVAVMIVSALVLSACGEYSAPTSSTEARTIKFSIPCPRGLESAAALNGLLPSLRNGRTDAIKLNYIRAAPGFHPCRHGLDKKQVP